MSDRVHKRYWRTAPGKANLFAFGMLLLLLVGGAGLLIYPRLRLALVQVQQSYLLFGTQVDLTVRTKNHDQAARALAACFQEMKRIQSLMSVHDEGSQLSQLNRSANQGWVTSDPDIFQLIERSLAISKASQGAFDITVGSLLEIWRLARQRGSPPSEDEIHAEMRYVGYSALEVDPQDKRVRFHKKGMSLDLGGIAKGYALDRGKEALLREGVQQALLNAGGDILLVGGKGAVPWEIGIRDPRDQSDLLGTLELRDRAVVTSGDYERVFMHNGERYHHILDPRTGYPSKGCSSVTVVGPQATEADAIATAAFVLGPEKGLAFLEKTADIDGIIIDSEGRKHVTSGLRGKVKWKH